MADTIQTFNWPVKVASPGTITQDKLKAQFGDGYAQRSGVGINNASRSYDVSITARASIIEAIQDFLLEHGGWRAFLWTPRLGSPGLYVAEDGFRVLPNGNQIYTLTTTFTQTFKP